jgi:hypothetical protein
MTQPFQGVLGRTENAGNLLPGMEARIVRDDGSEVTRETFVENG